MARFKDAAWTLTGLLFLSGFFLFFILSCGSTVLENAEEVPSITQAESPASELPSRRDLRRVLREKKVINIVYGTRNELFRKKNKDLATLNKDRMQSFEVRVLGDDEIIRDSILAYPLVLIGSPSSHSLIQELQPQLPFSWKKNCLSFDEKNWCDSSAVFALGFYPNPLNPSMPLQVVTAQNDQAIYDLFTQILHWDHILWDGWDYKIYQNKSKQLIGKFNNDEGGDWQVNREDQIDLREKASTQFSGKIYRFNDHNSGLDEADLQALMQQRESRAQEILAFTEKEIGLPPISYHLYPSTERKGLLLNNTDQMHINFRTEEVFAVHNDEFRDHPIELDNELILRSLLGQPRHAFLERGLGIYFCTNWQGKGYRNWAKLLHQSDNLVPLAELFDNKEFDRESEYVAGALAGSFVDFLLSSHWGKAKFLEKYASWQATAAEIAALEKAWHAFLSESPQALFPKREIQSKSCFRGFNFTHEGYQIYNGYISRKATESLEHISGIGGNAVAIVPYTGMRDHTKPTFLPISNGPGSENDESIVHSLHSARTLGMTTMLKPQVWLWNSWPGDVQMQNEEDWAKFFDYYYRWIRHYALMGEMREADILCMGVEFTHATLSHEAEWRAILHKLRGLFRGPITYAANWGDEFEKTGLWDELDYISINCYYPLSKKDNPSDEELKEGCKNISAKIERVVNKYQKPVLFTEIGFRSVTAPWQQPHEEAGERAYNAEDQARAYRIACESLRDKDWCRGIFWWKWPTIMTNDGDRDRRFIPYGKPAEQVIKDFYAEWE